MKFIIDYNGKVEPRLLEYIVEDYYIDTKPFFIMVDFEVILNTLTLAVDEDKRIVRVDGYCPHPGWEKTKCDVPAHGKGSLLVVEDFESGFAYSINDEDLPMFMNRRTGWVCIGNPEQTGRDAVEFINGCVAVIDEKDNLAALWMKPEIIGRMKPGRKLLWKRVKSFICRRNFLKGKRMTKERLVKKLDKMGVSCRLYSVLDEEEKDMAYNVKLMPDERYRVYNYERYERITVGYYDTLEDAYQAVYDRFWDSYIGSRFPYLKWLRKLFRCK